MVFSWRREKKYHKDKLRYQNLNPQRRVFFHLRQRESDGNLKDNGRNELKAQYRELYPDKTDKQANLAVTRAVRVVRGVMAPTKTPKRLVQKLIGAPTAHSSEESFKSNNKFNTILLGFLKEETEATIAAYTGEKEATWTSGELNDKVDFIMNDYFGDLNLPNENVIVHVFVGAQGSSDVQSAMKTECTKPLSYRGNQQPLALPKEEGTMVPNLTALKSLVAGKAKQGNLVSCFAAHTGTNTANTDELEKALQKRHIASPSRTTLVQARRDGHMPAQIGPKRNPVPLLRWHSCRQVITGRRGPPPRNRG